MVHSHTGERASTLNIKHSISQESRKDTLISFSS